jgi:hypothetical protein
VLVAGEGGACPAHSEGTSSGTGMTIDRWAGTSSANPPVASVALPVWMPGESRPSVKRQHTL